VYITKISLQQSFSSCFSC